MEVGITFVNHCTGAIQKANIKLRDSTLTCSDSRIIGLGTDDVK